MRIIRIHIVLPIPVGKSNIVMTFYPGCMMRFAGD